MRRAALAVVAAAALIASGDRGALDRDDAALAAMGVPFLAADDPASAAAFRAWTFAGPVVVTRDGAIAYAVGGPVRDAGAGAWRKTSSSSATPVTIVERFAGATPRPRAGRRSATDVASPDARLATWDTVELGEAWPGIAVSLRARARSIDKVFVIAPGASPASIRVELDGVEALRVDALGRLVAVTPDGEVAYGAPLAWQEGWLGRTTVAVAYAPSGTGYGFTVAGYDRARPLVIDPRLDAVGPPVERPRAS
jgi:hypothetical protein